MGQVENLHLYAVVVDKGSVTRAATTLNIANSAVSRHLALLENRYEAKLIERGPGTWKVTETGEEHYRRTMRAVGEVDEIDVDEIDTQAFPLDRFCVVYWQLPPYTPDFTAQFWLAGTGTPPGPIRVPCPPG